MRDIGILLWVAFLLIGVIGSIISSIRKQMAQSQGASPRVILSASAASSRRTPPGQVPEWVQRVVAQAAPPQTGVQPPRVILSEADRPSRRAVPVTPPPAPHLLDFPQHRPRRPLFADRKSIVLGVIAAEVFGKPRALGDEYMPH